MAFKKEDRPSGELNGFLDSGSRMKGDLHFEDTFRVDGHLEGTIESEGHLVVGEKGSVEGDVRVKRVHVAGTVRGTVTGAEKVEIAASGRVLGDLQTGSLVIEDGAVLEGSCRMESKSSATPADRSLAVAEVGN